MPNFDQTDLAVCEVCLHLLANGEYNDGTDAAELAEKGQEELWGANAKHLVPGGDDLGYSTRPCQGCGNHLHGDRFTATALIPKGQA